MTAGPGRALMQGWKMITKEKPFFRKKSKSAMLTLAGALLFIASSNVNAGPNSSLRDLEIRTWTADETELHKVELELVRIMQRDPNSAYAHHLMSHLMVRIYSKNPGDMYLLKQASDLAQQSIDLDPLFSGGYASYAHLLDLMGNTDAAMKLLGDAEGAGIEPNWRFYLTRARLTADITSPERTLELLKTALSFTETQPDIIVPYIIAIINTHKTRSNIISSLEDWNSKYPNEMFALSLGLAYTENQQYAQAEVLYNGILKKNPGHLEAQVNLAVLQYRYLNQSIKALASFEAILAGDSSKLTGLSNNMIHLHLGSAYLKAKKFDLAKKMFTDTVAKDPANVSVIDFVTNAYREENAHKELISFLQTVTRDIAGVGIYYALLGETLSEKIGNHTEAITAYNNAIVLDPGRSDYYNGLGLAIYRERNFDTALRAFVKATELDPTDATAHYNEACMLAILGKSEEAISSLAEAITLDPKLMRSAAIDDDFKNIRSSVKFRDLMAGPGSPEVDIGH